MERGDGRKIEKNLTLTLVKNAKMVVSFHALTTEDKIFEKLYKDAAS